MPGPSSVGGPRRVPAQPHSPPVTPEPSSAEAQREDAIDAVLSRSQHRPRRSSIPAYAGEVKSAFGAARGSSTMAATLVSRDTISQMAGKTPAELARNFQRAGLSGGEASAMAEAISQRVGNQLRGEVRTQGHALIAERRSQLTQSRDAIAALRDAPQGTPSAAVYDAMVERFGDEKISQLMEHFEQGLETMDNWDRRLDGEAWTLAEMADAARDVAEPGWLREDSIATDQLGRGTPFSDAAAVLQESAERVHIAYEIALFVTEIGHAVAEAAASGGGAILGGLAIAVHHSAHHRHEDFVEGMSQLFEDAR